MSDWRGARRVDGQAAGKRKPHGPGVIETIASGLSLVWARPILLILPVIYDLYLWLGVRVSPVSLTDGLAGWARRSGGADGDRIAESLRTVGDSANLTHLAALMTPSLLAGASKDTILIGLLGLMAPPLVTGIDRDLMYAEWGSGAFEFYVPANGWFVALIAVGLLFAASVLTMIYRVPLAQFVRGDRRSVPALLWAMVMAWLRFAGLVIVICGVGILILGPALIGTALLMLFGVNVAPLLGLAMLMLGGAAALYLYFVVDAIVVSEVGPLRAMYLSFNVVRRNLGQTVGLGLAILVIATGLPLVWEAIVGNPPGIAIALLGNAFIGTGLVLASMTFYYDRLRRWQDDRHPAQPGRRSPTFS